MEKIEDVYNQYFKDVYRYLLSITKNQSLAEEIAQETFFKAMKNINSFDGKCKITVWLCQIAKNTYLSHLKKEKLYDHDMDLSDIISDSDFERQFIHKETAFEIHKYLHQLDEPYKEVFSLRMFGELSFFQIGVLFGKTESWARVTYHRAKLKLKEELL